MSDRDYEALLAIGDAFAEMRDACAHIIIHASREAEYHMDVFPMVRFVLDLYNAHWEDLAKHLVSEEIVSERRSWAEGVREEVLRRYPVCLRCGAANDLEIDHVVPLSKGGSSDIENLQVLCSSCNASKGASYSDYRVPAGTFCKKCGS